MVPTTLRYAISIMTLYATCLFVIAWSVAITAILNPFFKN